MSNGPVAEERRRQMVTARVLTSYNAPPAVMSYMLQEVGRVGEGVVAGGRVYVGSGECPHQRHRSLSNRIRITAAVDTRMRMAVWGGLPALPARLPACPPAVACWYLAADAAFIFATLRLPIFFAACFIFIITMPLHAMRHMRCCAMLDAAAMLMLILFR